MKLSSYKPHNPVTQRSQQNGADLEAPWRATQKVNEGSKPDSILALAKGIDSVTQEVPNEFHISKSLIKQELFMLSRLDRFPDGEEELNELLCKLFFDRKINDDLLKRLFSKAAPILTPVDKETLGKLSSGMIVKNPDPDHEQGYLITIRKLERFVRDSDDNYKEALIKKAYSEIQRGLSNIDHGLPRLGMSNIASAANFIEGIGKNNFRGLHAAILNFCKLAIILHAMERDYETFSFQSLRCS